MFYKFPFNPLSVYSIFLCLTAKLPELTISPQMSPSLMKLRIPSDAPTPFQPKRAEVQTRTPDHAPYSPTDLTSPHTTAFAMLSPTFDDFDYKDSGHVLVESLPKKEDVLPALEFPPLPTIRSQPIHLDEENFTSGVPVKEKITTSSLEATLSPSSSPKIVTPEPGLPSSTMEVGKDTALVFKDGVPPMFKLDLEKPVSLLLGEESSTGQPIQVILVSVPKVNESGESSDRNFPSGNDLLVDLNSANALVSNFHSN